MHDRLVGLDIFVAVAEAQGFSAAAATLGISKAHVSRQVNQLEQRLNTRLFNRTTRRVSLTEEGRAFFERCREILGNLDEAEQAMQDLQEIPRGRLRISVAGAFAEDYITPAAVDYMQRYPEVSVELDFSNRLVDLVEDGYDLAIRAGVLKDSSLFALRLSDRNLHIVASRDYLQRKGTPMHPQDLEHHNCLLGTLPSWRLLVEGEHLDQRVEGNWRSNNGHALLEAACRGLGLAQLPFFYVRDELEAGRLVSVLEAFSPRDSAIWAVYPHNRHLSARVRLFLGFLKERLQAGQWVAA